MLLAEGGSEGMGEIRREDYVRDCGRRVMQMVAELHRMGYERLRIVPGMAPSGLHWRCNVTHVGNIRPDNGAMPEDYHKDSAIYTTGCEDQFFQWEDARDDTPVQLAEKFLERKAELAEKGKGEDPEYAAWYREMLEWCVEEDEFPVAYDDWGDEPDKAWLPTTKRVRGDLRRPPGEMRQ